MDVSEIGEFGLIEAIRKLVSAEGHPPELLIGIGDDAAVWRPAQDIEIATTDTMVEGVHFDLSYTGWRVLGWKALAINISDIAAMGGSPRYALVSLCLPKDRPVESIVQMYQGMLDLARKHRTTIVGGNISASPVLVITLTVIGTGAQGKILTRTGARTGDRLAVTGYLGSSAAGLKMLSGGIELDADTAAYLRRVHLTPEPRVAEGLALVASGIRTGMDISDGLLGDLTHICEASGKSARVYVDRLPIHPMVRKAFKTEAIDLALSGGEDYELLFAGDETAISSLKTQLDLPVTIIGEMAGGPPGITVVDADGKTISQGGKGWEHFVSR